jgi:peroxiredoxin
MMTTAAPIRFGLLFSSLVLVFTVGCQNADNTWMVQGKDDSPPAPPSSHHYAYPEEAPLVAADDVLSLINRFRQRVIVLDVWAAWNRRCRDEMIGLTQLQQEFGDGRLQVISCNLDSPAEWKQVTVPVLHGAEANFPCVVLERDSRPALREWLGGRWDYDLPARFIIDRQGQVAGEYFGDASMDQVQNEARRAVESAGRGDIALRSASAAINGKLINVQTGEAHPIPNMTSDSSDGDELIQHVVKVISSRLGGTEPVRVAILPFAASRSTKGDAGTKLAEGVVDGLRSDRNFEMVGPAATQRMVQDAGLTATSIDFDPPIVTGQLPADYLVVGRLDGELK